MRTTSEIPDIALGWRGQIILLLLIGVLTMAFVAAMLWKNAALQYLLSVRLVGEEKPS